MTSQGKADSISPVFDGILSCPVQAIPSGPNETKMFKIPSGKNCLHYILLVPMPKQSSYCKYIPKFLKEFQSLCKSPVVKSGYKSGVEGISLHPGMLSYVSEEGKYWNVLDDATKEEFIFQYCQSLD